MIDAGCQDRVVSVMGQHDDRVVSMIGQYDGGMISISDQHDVEMVIMIGQYDDGVVLYLIISPLRHSTVMDSLEIYFFYEFSQHILLWKPDVFCNI